MQALPLVATGFLLTLSVAAYADHPPGHRPPPEAFEACKSAKRGDACTVKHGDHTIAGVCDAPPDVTELACHPAPPPESFAACESKTEGDRCAFDHDGHSVAGTCSKGPHGEPQLGCKPDQPPPR